MDIWYLLRTYYKKRTALFSTHIREKSSFFQRGHMCIYTDKRIYLTAGADVTPPPPLGQIGLIMNHRYH